MSDRVQARGRTGIAGDENHLALFCSSRRPFEVTRRMNRLIVFVNAHQRHVDVEAREIEIVRIAAKKCCLKLRHERSEERRVGKECTSRGSRDEYNKKNKRAGEASQR